eukprot:scaffold735_cov255-Pinguiococcus_pyrenoidosus.AAC.30
MGERSALPGEGLELGIVLKICRSELQRLCGALHRRLHQRPSSAHLRGCILQSVAVGRHGTQHELFIHLACKRQDLQDRWACWEDLLLEQGTLGNDRRFWEACDGRWIPSDNSAEEGPLGRLRRPLHPAQQQ